MNYKMFSGLILTLFCALFVDNAAAEAGLFGDIKEGVEEGIKAGNEICSLIGCPKIDGSIKGFFFKYKCCAANQKLSCCLTPKVSLYIAGGIGGVLLLLAIIGCCCCCCYCCKKKPANQHVLLVNQAPTAYDPPTYMPPATTVMVK